MPFSDTLLELTGLPGESKDTPGTASTSTDPEWKYVNVRRSAMEEQAGDLTPDPTVADGAGGGSADEDLLIGGRTTHDSAYDASFRGGVVVGAGDAVAASGDAIGGYSSSQDTLMNSAVAGAGNTAVDAGAAHAGPGSTLDDVVVDGIIITGDQFSFDDMKVDGSDPGGESYVGLCHGVSVLAWAGMDGSGEFDRDSPVVGSGRSDLLGLSHDAGGIDLGFGDGSVRFVQDAVDLF